MTTVGASILNAHDIFVQAMPQSGVLPSHDVTTGFVNSVGHTQMAQYYQGGPTGSTVPIADANSPLAATRAPPNSSVAKQLIQKGVGTLASAEGTYLAAQQLAQAPAFQLGPTVSEASGFFSNGFAQGMGTLRSQWLGTTPAAAGAEPEYSTVSEPSVTEFEADSFAGYGGSVDSKAAADFDSEAFANQVEQDYSESADFSESFHYSDAGLPTPEADASVSLGESVPVDMSVIGPEGEALEVGAASLAEEGAVAAGAAAVGETALLAAGVSTLGAAAAVGTALYGLYQVGEGVNELTGGDQQWRAVAQTNQQYGWL